MGRFILLVLTILCVPAEDQQEQAQANLSRLGAEFLQETHEGHILVRADFRWSRVKDDDLVRLKDIAGLVQVRLYATGITDAGLVHLRKLDQLRELQLGITAITDKGLAELADLTELRLLHLSLTMVGDEGMVHLWA